MTEPQTYTLKLLAGGRVTVPKAVRDQLGVQPGDHALIVKDERGFWLTTREAWLARAYAESADEMRADPLFDLDSGHGLSPE